MGEAKRRRALGLPPRGPARITLQPSRMRSTTPTLQTSGAISFEEACRRTVAEDGAYWTWAPRCVDGRVVGADVYELFAYDEDEQEEQAGEGPAQQVGVRVMGDEWASEDGSDGEDDLPLSALPECLRAAGWLPVPRKGSIADYSCLRLRDFGCTDANVLLAVRLWEELGFDALMAVFPPSPAGVYDVALAPVRA